MVDFEMKDEEKPDKRFSFSPFFQNLDGKSINSPQVPSTAPFTSTFKKVGFNFANLQAQKVREKFEESFMETTSFGAQPRDRAKSTNVIDPDKLNIVAHQNSQVVDEA